MSFPVKTPEGLAEFIEEVECGVSDPKCHVIDIFGNSKLFLRSELFKITNSELKPLGVRNDVYRNKVSRPYGYWRELERST